MKLTALEIKQQKFEKSLRGYEINEVNAFLNMVASEYENLVSRQRDLERDLAQLKDKLKHYERVESALHETLQTAKDTAEQRLAGARQEAKSRVEKAEHEAEAILRDANQQRQQVRQDIMRLLERRDDIIRGIRSYLDMASESLNIFSRDDTGQFTLPGEPKAEAAPKSKSKPKATEATAPVASADDLDAILDQIE